MAKWNPEIEKKKTRQVEQISLSEKVKLVELERQWLITAVFTLVLYMFLCGFSLSFKNIMTSIVGQRSCGMRDQLSFIHYQNSANDCRDLQRLKGAFFNNSPFLHGCIKLVLECF